MLDDCLNKCVLTRFKKAGMKLIGLLTAMTSAGKLLHAQTSCSDKSTRTLADLRRSRRLLTRQRMNESTLEMEADMNEK